MPTDPSAQLHRRLGLADSVLVGLGAMLGAGIFAALAPAAGAAGSGLLVALAIAAVVAYCNATSSAQLAAHYPESGGTYVYGRERLGPFWGYLAGWSFVVGKTASCAAMALTVGAYAWPAQQQAVAVGTVAAATAINYFGIRKSALVTRVIVAVVLAVLVAVVVACAAGSDGQASPFEDLHAPGILQAAGLLFFAFAGYARIATLGAEVHDPRRTIPRAIGIALAITLVVYAAVATAVLYTLGPASLAAATDPLAAAVEAVGADALVPAVRIGAVVAAAGSLLALVLGVSRTTFAMAKDGNLPRALSSVHSVYGVPHRAELAVGCVVAILAAIVDLRSAIGFSSFAVLFYYLVANASAWTLGGRQRWTAASGAVGCVVVGFSLPTSAVVGGLVVLGAGVAVRLVRRIT